MIWTMGLPLFGPVFMGFALVLNLAAMIWALVMIARADKDVGYKLIWALIAFVLGVLGAVLYYLIEFQNYPKKRHWWKL